MRTIEHINLSPGWAGVLDRHSYARDGRRGHGKIRPHRSSHAIRPASPPGFQWLYADPNSGNPVGFLTSNGRFVRLGPRTCPNRYVYDLFDETVPTGTLQAGGPIARVAAIP